MIAKKAEFVNKQGHNFVDKTQGFVDKTPKRVNSVNKVVNKTKGGLLTPNIKSFRGLNPLSTMSTKNIIKMYVCNTYSNSSKTHIYVCARADEGCIYYYIQNTKVFKKLC